MRTLPLYPAPLQVPLTSGQRLDPVKDCNRCQLGIGTQSSVCISAELVEGAGPGVLLVIDAMPDSGSDRAGRPFTSERGTVVRGLTKSWGGNVVLDYAQKCRGECDDAAAKCSPYMRQVFDEADPDRVIVLGHKAARSVLGRYIPTIDTRKAYSWVTTKSGKQVPVFTVIDPDQAADNKFLKQYLNEDFYWACTVDPGTLFQPVVDEVFHIVETLEDAQLADEYLRTQEWTAYDCETAGKMFSDFFKVSCVSLTPGDADTAYVWGRKALANPAARQVLLDILSDYTIGKVGHNLKYDQLAARAGLDTEVRGAVLDTQLTRHLELPGCLVSLEVCSEMIGMGGYKQDFDKLLVSARKSIHNARKRSNKNRQLSLLQEDPVLVAAMANPEHEVDAYAYGLIQTPDLERYNARDTVATRRFAMSRSGFELVSKHAPTRNIWRAVTSKMTDAYTQIEAWGIPCDRTAIREFNAYITDKVTKSDKQFEKLGINLNSPPQKAGYLFDKLKLRDPKDKGKKPSRSTDKHAMKRMIDQHPLVAAIMENTRLHTLKKNYGTLDKFIRSDGRIHPSFRIDGTATGRASLADPSLHTIPRESDGAGNKEGQMIKACFAAAPGRKIVALDQSQIEYRVAAAESQDPVMRSMFLSGDDFHMNTAGLIAPMYWGIPAEAVQKQHRSEAKQFSFGLLYGQGDRTIADALKIDVSRATELRAAIMGKWVNLAAWIKDQIEYGNRTGTCVSTWNGQPARIRNLYQIGNLRSDSLSMGAKITATNGTFNSPIQGKGSDFVQNSVTKLVPWLLASDIDAKLILTVHDSIMFDCREDHVDRLIAHVRGVMTDYELWGVPLIADAEFGDDWGHMKKVA